MAKFKVFPVDIVKRTMERLRQEAIKKSEESEDKVARQILTEVENKPVKKRKMKRKYK